MLPQHITGDKAKLITQWLTWADKDYVASRRLLLEGLLVQGASLANTAIEKYIKAILTVHDQAILRIHDPHRLYELVPASDSLELNTSFLILIGKAYKMRYPDDLPVGYNIPLCQILMLYYLDISVARILSKFDFKNARGENRVGLLRSLIDEKDPNAVLYNVSLGTISKEDLLALPSKVYENRLLDNGIWMEIDYITAKIESDNLEAEGFVQVNDTQFNLSHTPISEEHAHNK